ncbi:MAG: aspartate carbamoyltransferase catalytic subunit [SAR202 cluster bacterium]|nr:aspartate carbamoyltransferase catalytic subunit [SAR202 cluster bacterium]
MTTPQAAAPAITSLAPRRQVLDLDDFTREEIDLVLGTTESMREVLGRSIKKVPSLRGKIIMTLFLEPSTRTRVSFEQAGKILSADVINLSGSGSSAEKGESLLNTGLTLQAMHADLIVMRHKDSGAPYLLARHLKHAGIVNAGDGRHAHPSQALLDLYTMRRHLGSLEGRKVVIIGDVAHSRVARSNIFGLSAAGARVVLCGPPTLLPLELLRGRDTAYPTANVSVETDLDKAIDGADVVMALRIQTERMEGGATPSMREYTRRWQVTEARMRKARPNALLMHPGPMNEGIELASSLAHGDAQRIEEQVTNGVATRMALLYLLLNGPEASA